MKAPTRTVWFYYDANGRRVAMDVSGTVYYYIYNAMGDVIGLYDGSGKVVARYSYDAWGRVITVKEKTTLMQRRRQNNRYAENNDENKQAAGQANSSERIQGTKKSF